MRSETNIEFIGTQRSRLPSISNMEHFKIPDSVVCIETSDLDELTIHKSFQASVKRSPDGRMLGRRPLLADGKGFAPYQWLTYKDAADMVTDFASGIAEMGFKKGNMFGIMSLNRTEWIIADLACASMGYISVPMYDSQGAEDLEYVVNHAELKYVFVERVRLNKFAAVKAKCPAVEKVIMMDWAEEDVNWMAEHKGKDPNEEGIDAKTKEARTLANMVDMTFRDVMALGSEHPHPADDSIQSNELYTIVYTSGTTGGPKGAMISHKNLISSYRMLNTRLPPCAPYPQHTHISYLPLAHIFERTICTLLIGEADAIGFFTGNPVNLAFDIAALKPTLLAGVPRVYGRLYDRITGLVEGGSAIKRWMFKKAFAAQEKRLFQEVPRPRSGFWDKLVFKKVAARFGGRLKLAFSGSAPLPPHIAKFVTIAFQTPLAEGYGLTETCSTCAVMDVPSYDFGNVGKVLPNTEVKLVDVPELEYRSSDKPYPRGEILMRNTATFMGYYKQEEKTKEVFDDGWFMTGDIGMYKNGKLFIIDRKKNIFKLQQGEFVCAESIETAMKNAKFSAMNYLYANRYEAFMLAAVVPEWGVLKPALSSAGIDIQRSLPELCADPKVIAMVHTNVIEACKAAKLRAFEIPRAVYLEEVEYTPDNNLMTPSFKLKRVNLKNRYETVMEEVFVQLKKLPNVLKASEADVAAVVAGVKRL